MNRAGGSWFLNFYFWFNQVLEQPSDFPAYLRNLKPLCLDDAGAFILDTQRDPRVRFPVGVSTAPWHPCGGLQTGLEGVRCRIHIAKTLTVLALTLLVCPLTPIGV